MSRAPRKTSARPTKAMISPTVVIPYSAALSSLVPLVLRCKTRMFQPIPRKSYACLASTTHRASRRLSGRCFQLLTAAQSDCSRQTSSFRGKLFQPCSRGIWRGCAWKVVMECGVKLKSSTIGQEADVWRMSLAHELQCRAHRGKVSSIRTPASPSQPIRGRRAW